MFIAFIFYFMYTCLSVNKKGQGEEIIIKIEIEKLSTRHGYIVLELSLFQICVKRNKNAYNFAICFALKYNCILSYYIIRISTL